MKLYVYPDNSCFLKTGSGGAVVASFSSVNDYAASSHYSSAIPILHVGPTISANPSLNSKKSIRTPVDVMPARPNFLFGADPEGFVADKNGKPVAPSMIPGTKEKPHKVDGGAIQRDGMAAEYNVDPVNTFEEWNSNHEKVQKALEGFLPKGYSMLWVPSVEFDPDVFDPAPDDYKELGCSPDWNAWDEDLNPPPFCEDKPYLRTASGHIHLGWGKDYSLDNALHQRNCFDLVKQLDWWLAGWSLKHDPDPTRRELYGKAGACRLKPYGVEYRVLSNFWVTNETRRKAVWNRMQQAISDMERRFLPERAPEGYNSKLIEAINVGKMDNEFRKACKFPLATSNPSYAAF